MKYLILLLLPLYCLAQPTGTTKTGKVVINSNSTPTEKLYVNGASTLNGALKFPTLTDGYLYVNGDGTVTNADGPSPGAGGTGQVTVDPGDILVGVSNNWIRLPAIASGNVLKTNGVGVAPSYGKITNNEVDPAAAIALTKISIPATQIPYGTSSSSGFTYDATNQLVTINNIRAGHGKGAGLTNTAFGDGSLNSAYGTSQGNNTVIGYKAGAGIVYFGEVPSVSVTRLGLGNTVIGASAMVADSNRSAYNVIAGYLSGNKCFDCYSNVFVGIRTGSEAKTVNYATGVGTDSQRITTANDNSSLGAKTLYTNTTGTRNAVVGTSSMYYNETGNDNSTIGFLSLEHNTTGSFNTALGSRALSANTTASNNTAVGHRALETNTTGTFNTAVGKDALEFNLSTSSNTAVGYQTLRLMTSSSNTAIGSTALTAATGTGNTAIGAGAGSSISTGTGNVLIGRYSGVDVATGANNIILSHGGSTTSSGVMLFIKGTTGNVGIGTLVADPTQKLQVAGNIAASGKLILDATNTTAGTTGNQTINKPSGTVNIAAAGTTVTVTNSFCTTSSIVYAVVRTNDTTAVIKNVVPGSGSFVINLSAAATAETSIGFIVYN